jgi:hypothetical protein
MTRYIGPIFWTPHLLSLDSRLFQFLVPQAPNPSLLTSPQASWAPLSFLPDVFTLMFFLINPFLISISLPWVIINFIYFYAPTVTGMYPSNSFMNGVTVKIRQPSHEFTFGVGMTFVSYPLVLTPVV